MLSPFRAVPALLAGLLLTMTLACAQDRFTSVNFANGVTVNCEIAATPEAQTAGLTTYDQLAAEQGMIFPYQEERTNVSYWMPARMKFPIDILFLNKDKRIVFIVHNAQPCASNLPEECPTYGPGATPVQYVVEVVAGFCDRHGVRSGEQLSFTLP